MRYKTKSGQRQNKGNSKIRADPRLEIYKNALVKRGQKLDYKVNKGIIVSTFFF
jgi:hypothetical protein